MPRFWRDTAKRTDEDELFSTSVDVQAKLNDGTEGHYWDSGVSSLHYFLNRFHYYLANQLVENVQQLRQQEADIGARADGPSLA